MKEWHKLVAMIAVFLSIYFIPFSHPRVEISIVESFHLLQYYVREHVLTCLIPAFFIAGAIANFISQGSVLKYFGGTASKWISYPVSSVSGSVLAVCSCTVLPLFAGIWKKGAGIGPAVAFLYSGPAINVLAIILTARVLGWELGVARAVGAVIFAIVIGLLMSNFFRTEGVNEAQSSWEQMIPEDSQNRSSFQNLLFFFVLILILVFAAWAEPVQAEGFWYLIFSVKWPLVILLLAVLGFILIKWFDKEESYYWVDSTWGFAKQILPLLLVGVLIAGLLMGRPGTEAGLIPAEFIESAVGGNTLQANLLASVIGAFMYFATLTEVPILEGLIGSGMGQGPALALLLAGPALSLPNMLVIRGVMGNKKTAVFIVLVVCMATVSGMIYGSLF